MAGENGAVGAEAGAVGDSGSSEVDPTSGAAAQAEEQADGRAGQPAKKAAKPQKASEEPEDPDFEYEEPGPDEKTPATKHKIKMSEAKKRLATLQREKAEIAAQRAAIQRHVEEQITPLEQTIQDLQRDPTKLIELSRRLGVDPRKAMEHLAREELKLLEMTPEQRRVYQLEQELARRDAAEKERQTRQQQEKQQKQRQETQQRIAQGILQAADAAKLPKHPMALSLMSGFLRAQVNGGQTPDPAQAAEAVKEFVLDYTKKSIADLTYDQIVGTFPDVVKKIREGDSSKISVDPQVARPPQRKPEPKVKRAMSAAEFTAKLMRGE